MPLKKKLISGQPIIEAASGPFAAALTLAGLTAGHPVVLVMPEDAPALRQETLLRLGAQIRHSPARSGVNGARRLAAQTAAANGWYYMDWLANDDNPSTTAALPALPLCRASRGRAKALWTLS